MQTELKRKAIHFWGGVCIPLGYYFYPADRLDEARYLIWSVAVVAVCIDVLRLHVARVRHYFLRAFGTLLRPHEQTQLTAASYLLMACALSVSIFPHRIAVTALMFLVVGDTAAALVGTSLGRIRFGDKSLEGSLACFSVCLGVTGLFMNFSLLFCLIAATIATLSEALPGMDDNFQIPLISGVALWTLSNI
ncbi:MAG: hypothetical protein D6675_07675 [Gemmatimonadetes bacterium]|nr:MAG: hypothetical protein D6675_07675 [Gemmatimonadota bacterium]